MKTDKRMDIYTGLTKDQAYQFMVDGYKIAHDYYSNDEYLYMKGGIIYDENNYYMGTYYDDFWSKIQKWETGWKTAN